MGVINSGSGVEVTAMAINVTIPDYSQQDRPPDAPGGV
jgi:hypothetical protein